MQNSVKKMLRQMFRDKKRQKRIVAVICALSVLVATGVFNELMQPVITMTPDPVCGVAEHAHTSECYQNQLVCGIEESEEHAHGDGCFESVLACGKSEHKHGDSCYPEEIKDQPVVTAEPEVTAEPTEVPAVPATVSEEAPEVTAEPETTEVPEVTAEPESTEAPEVTAEPEITAEPEVTAEPETTEVPEVTAEPETTEVPEVTAEPETTEVPEVTAEPETTAEPDPTAEPAEPAAPAAPAITGATASAETAFVGQTVTWTFAAEGASELTYSIDDSEGNSVASGALDAGATCVSWLADRAGAFTLTVTAVNEFGSASITGAVTVEAAAELTAAVRGDSASAFAGESATFHFAVSGGVEPTAVSITVEQDGETLAALDAMTDSVTVEPRHMGDKVTTLTATITAADSLGTTVSDSVQIPVAVRIHETESDWIKATETELTDDWRENLIAVAKTQLGYEESRLDFVIDEEGNVQGYTRYGQWWGASHDEWCAMFASFCLNYAEIPDNDFPREANCEKWIDALNSRGLYAAADEVQPEAGDLIFFDWENDGKCDHVGIVTDVDTETIATIEGNSAASVRTREYEAGDECIIGFGLLTKAFERHLADELDLDLETGVGAQALVLEDAILRAEPASDSMELAALTAETLVTVTAAEQNLDKVWYEITTDDLTGYLPAATLALNYVAEEDLVEVEPEVETPSVEITSARETNAEGVELVTFTAALNGISEADYIWQWQSAETAEGPWTDIEGATGLTYTAELTDAVLASYYRIHGAYIALPEEESALMTLSMDEVSETETADAEITPAESTDNDIYSAAYAVEMPVSAYETLSAQIAALVKPEVPAEDADAEALAAYETALAEYEASKVTLAEQIELAYANGELSDEEYTELYNLVRMHGLTLGEQYLVQVQDLYNEAVLVGETTDDYYTQMYMCDDIYNRLWLVYDEAFTAYENGELTDEEHDAIYVVVMDIMSYMLETYGYEPSVMATLETNTDAYYANYREKVDMFYWRFDRTDLVHGVNVGQGYGTGTDTEGVDFTDVNTTYEPHVKVYYGTESSQTGISYCAYKDYETGYSIDDSDGINKAVTCATVLGDTYDESSTTVPEVTNKIHVVTDVGYVITGYVIACETNDSSSRAEHVGEACTTAGSADISVTLNTSGLYYSDFWIDISAATFGHDSNRNENNNYVLLLQIAQVNSDIVVTKEPDKESTSAGGTFTYTVVGKLAQLSDAELTFTNVTFTDEFFTYVDDTVTVNNVSKAKLTIDSVVLTGGTTSPKTLSPTTASSADGFSYTGEPSTYYLDASEGIMYVDGKWTEAYTLTITYTYQTVEGEANKTLSNTVIMGGTRTDTTSTAEHLAVAEVNVIVNEPNKGSLRVYKTFEGLTTPEVIGDDDTEGVLKEYYIEVKKDDTLVATFKINPDSSVTTEKALTYYSSDLTDPITYTYYGTLTGLEAGTYTVREYCYDYGEYSCRATYSVQVGESGTAATGSGDTASATVQNDTTTFVLLENTYNNEQYVVQVVKDWVCSDPTGVTLPITLTGTYGDSTITRTATLSADNNWTYVFGIDDSGWPSNANEYTWTVKETLPSDGNYYMVSWEVDDSVTEYEHEFKVEIENSDSSTTIVTETKTYPCVGYVLTNAKYASLTISKVDESGESLSGATFQLHKLASKGAANYDQTFGTGGMKELSLGSVTESLTEGYYKLTETAAPAGYYMLTSVIYFRVDANGNVSLTDSTGENLSSTEGLAWKLENGTLTITNHTGTELPNTGGPGKYIYTICGLFFMAASLLCGIGQRRKRERGEEI